MWRGLLLLLCLTGCASTPVAVAPVGQFTPFVLSGRVAVQQGERRQSAGLRWAHRRQSDTVDLLTPLGGTAARIYRDTQRATLEEGQRRADAANLDGLMQQMLGWSLPLDGLQYWVLARPVPDVPAQLERNAAGQLTLLRQQDWLIRYTRYPDEQPSTLPTRMQLEYGTLRVQLLLDAWDWSLSE